MPEDMKAGELLPLVTEVVAAKLSNGKTPSSEVAPLIQSVYQVLHELRINGTPAELPEPAVPIRRSVTPDYIVCLEDGRQLSDGRTELCEEAQSACEECRAWYATASEAREGIGPSSRLRSEIVTPGEVEDLGGVGSSARMFPYVALTSAIALFVS